MANRPKKYYYEHMKLTVLVDNNTLIDRYYLGEPGVSFFIETGASRVLFDVGYSDAFLRNARTAGLDLLSTDYVVLSHGHIDHTGGLDALLKAYMEARFERGRTAMPQLVAHPDALMPKFMTMDGADAGAISIGSPISAAVLGLSFDLRPSDRPLWLDDRLVFLGEIERRTDFEQPDPIGRRGGAASGSTADHAAPAPNEPDQLLDDTAMAYLADDGLVIITGCSHAGICNIVETARRVTGVDKVIDIIGGFHLLDPPQTQLEGTVEYLRTLNLPQLHACHCTDLDSKIALSTAAPLKEVGSGLVIEY